MERINETKKRTIQSALDHITGEEVIAKDFFQQDESVIWKYRFEIQSSLSKGIQSRFLCNFCHQPVKIAGKSGTTTRSKCLHFAHYRNSPSCPIKTGEELTKEQILRSKYNGAKESRLHIDTKEFIIKALNDNRIQEKGVISIEKEKHTKHNKKPYEYRRPDVSVKYNQIKLAIEIQLSTTFLSVIADRERFYKENETFILWVFKKFTTDIEYQRFTEKDVFYSNNRNAFILDELAIEKSKEAKDLVLRCDYQFPFLEGNNISYKWESAYVTLEKLTFEPSQWKLFYFDVEGETNKIIKKEAELALKMKEYSRRLIETQEKEKNLYLKVENILKNRIVNSYPKPYTPLMRLFVIFSKNTDEKIYDLFKDGYQCDNQDKNFLNVEFKKEFDSRSMLERDDPFTCICLAILLYRLNSKELISEFKRLSGLIFAILSLKIGKVVGYKFSKIIQIAHQIMLDKRGHADLYIKAINTYNSSLIRGEDVSGKLQKKIDNYVREKKHNDNQSDNTMKKIFPELFT